MSLRVKNHIVLDVKDERKTVTITVDGKPVQAKEGEPILSSLLAAGIKINRYTRRFHEPRGLFCAIGQCTDCVMVVNGKPNVRTCVTPVQEGMVVETQDGLEQKGDTNDPRKRCCCSWSRSSRVGCCDRGGKGGCSGFAG